MSEYELDDRGWIPYRGRGCWVGVTQLPVQWVPEILSAGRGVLLATPTPSNAEVKKKNIYTSFPPKRHSWPVAGTIDLYSGLGTDSL